MGRMFRPAPELSVLELSVAAVSSDRHAAWTGTARGTGECSRHRSSGAL